MHKTLLAAILFYCCCCSKPQQAIPVYGMYLDAAAQVIKVTDYGAKADDDQSDSLAFSQAMLQAHLLHRPLYLPEGRFNAIIKIPYDSIEIIGARKPGIDRNNAFTRGTVIEGWINASGHSAIKVTGLGIDCRKFSGYDAALNSGETNTWKALNQVFSHLTIYGGGYRQYTHGILCQAGSGITIADIDVYNFYHGIAIRHSDVTVTDVRSYRCGFTSVIVKSALGNEITRNVQVSHISSYGNDADAYERAGTILVMSLDDHCLTENVTISDITSFFGGVSAVSVQQMKGTTRNVVIRNVTAADQGEDRSRACYEIINGENIQLYNCSSLRARGDAFRATGTGKNISVQHCFEQQTAGSPYVGYFDHLELNNRVIVP